MHGRRDDAIGPSYCKIPGRDTGPFRMLTWADRGAVGKFGLHAWRLNNPVGCTDIGSMDDGFGPLVGTLSDPGELDCYRGTFGGGTLSVTTSNDDDPDFAPRALFVRPNGTGACAVTGSGSCGLPKNTYSIIIGRNFGPPVFTGHYRVVGEVS